MAQSGATWPAPLGGEDPLNAPLWHGDFMIREDVVAVALAEAAQSAEPGEIGYMALSGKVELAVRDRMAWWFAKNLARDAGLVAVREWRRVDLALVTQQAEPVLLMEGKAHYHFDTMRPRIGGYVDRVAADLASLMRWPQAIPAAFALSTHIGTRIDGPLRTGGVVKYAGGTNRFLRLHDDDPEAALSTGRDRITKAYEEVGAVHGPLNVADTAVLGIDIVVDGWVITPTPAG